MKVALTQMDICWEDKITNYKKAEEFAKKAYEAGAEMLLFPEMSFTGFSMDTEKTAEVMQGETVQRMYGLSRQYPGMVIGFGYAAFGGEHEDKARNCLELVCNGESVLHYEKLHPFSYGKEAEFFAGGNRIPVCKVSDIHISGFICYDLRFPEVFQIASKKSELIFVIANWPKERELHWRVLLQARAIENQAYVIGINRIGEGDGISYVPSSMGFDPYGNPLVGEFYSLEASAEGFWLVDVEASVVTKLRNSFPLKSDRREKYYAECYENELF